MPGPIDDLCVALLRASTPRAYLARADADERLGVDPYDDGFVMRTPRDPRERLGECPECGAFFRWSGGGTFPTYCSKRCQVNRWSRENYRRKRAAA